MFHRKKTSPEPESDELTLTPAEALQSIAVELHRANELRVQEVRALVAIGQALERSQGQAHELHLESSRGLTDTLATLMTSLGERKFIPPAVEVQPGLPPRVEVEAGNIRVSQDPRELSVE